MSDTGELLVYQSEDGSTRVTCRVAEGTVWLNQAEPSGIPWLGDIPQHWQVRRIKYLLREVDE